MQVERLSQDGLRREVWRFWLSTPHFGKGGNVSVTTSYYGIESRATTRHKFKSDPSLRFDTYDQRSYNSGIVAAKVPLPDDVVEEVKRRIVVTVHRPDVDKRFIA